MQEKPDKKPDELESTHLVAPCDDLPSDGAALIAFAIGGLIAIVFGVSEVLRMLAKPSH